MALRAEFLSATLRKGKGESLFTEDTGDFVIIGTDARTDVNHVTCHHGVSVK